MITVAARVPARGGSKGIPRKNVLPVGGRPLIAWTIEAALGTLSLDGVYVSTDDEEIAQVAREYGAKVPFIEPPELASDQAGSLGVALHALDLSTGGEALKGLDSSDRLDNCLIWTLCGVPAINLPVFSGPQGLPFGAQIFARRYNDYLLLNFARHLKSCGVVSDAPYPAPTLEFVAG